MTQLLDDFRQNPGFLSALLEVQIHLKQSGILEFLHERSKPKAVPSAHVNYIAAQAFEAARSVGYSQCLEDILNFRELYLDQKPLQKTPLLDYGALEDSVKLGDITPEEADAIRAGESAEQLAERFVRAAESANRGIGVTPTWSKSD